MMKRDLIVFVRLLKRDPKNVKKINLKNLSNFTRIY